MPSCRTIRARCCRRSAAHWLAGLLANARAAAAFTTPTINGYKRYRAYALAPDRAIWGQDNRGVMVRVIGQPGDAGDASGKSDRRAGGQSVSLSSPRRSRLASMAWRDSFAPPPSADTPYETEAEMMPKNLGEALDALRDNACFRGAFGDDFVDYYLRIKDAEIARFRTEEKRRHHGGHALGAEGIFRSVLRCGAEDLRQESGGAIRARPTISCARR